MNEAQRDSGPGTKIGVVTIGQAPRADVVPHMVPAWGKGVTVVEIGALDGLTRTEIARLAPDDNNDLLVTRMADGCAVVVGHRLVTPRMQMAVNDLAEQDCDPIVVLCTGVFELESPGPRLVYPRKVLEHLAVTMGLATPGVTLGLLVPDPKQEEPMADLWRKLTSRVIATSASPYEFNEGPAAFERAGEKLYKGDARVIVMDCMGYTPAMRRALLQRAQVPVVLANQAVAYAAKP